MATGARGEAFLTVDGENLPILFTNRAIFQAERMTGKPILRILNTVSEQNLSIGDLVQLLHIGLEHGRRDAHLDSRPYTLNRAWDVMDTVGFRAVTVAVYEALAEVLSYSQAKDDESPPGD